MEISAIEYKMARRNQTRDHQTEELKKLQIQLERQTVIRTGCNNAIRALDHVIFDDDIIDITFHHLMDPMRSAPIPKLRRIPNFR